MLSTSELSILQASKEIHLFAERIHRMFGMVRDLLHTEKGDDFNKLFSRIEKYENISDSMELEIANYLNKVSEGRLSSESKLQIRDMLREVTEIESIGDSCYNLARTINRKRQSDEDFTEKQYEHIHTMMKLVDDALAQMIAVVERTEHAQVDVNRSFNLENEINNYRNQLKNQNIVDVNNKLYSYQMGVYYRQQQAVQLPDGCLLHGHHRRVREAGRLRSERGGGQQRGEREEIGLKAIG